MTSESPGVSSRTNPPPRRDDSQCLARNNLATPRPSRPRQSGVLDLVLVSLMLSWLVVTRVTAEGFCDPLLCSCQLASANCSWRGLLSLPSGLHDNIKYLGEF